MKGCTDVDNQLEEAGDKYKQLINSTAYNLSTWNESLREDFTSQFNLFKHNFKHYTNLKQQLDQLYETVQQLPNYKLRKIGIKSPHDKAKILTKYSQIDVIYLF